MLVTAGGRADLEIVMPAEGSGVRVEMAGSAALVIGSSAATPTPRPAGISICWPTARPHRSASTRAAPDRRLGYEIGRRPGFVSGLPGLWAWWAPWAAR